MGFRSELITVIFALEADTTAYLLLPGDVKQGNKSFCFSETERPDFLNSGIDITTEAGKAKLKDRLWAIETPHTVDNLKGFGKMLPFGSLF